MRKLLYPFKRSTTRHGSLSLLLSVFLPLPFDHFFFRCVRCVGAFNTTLNHGHARLHCFNRTFATTPKATKFFENVIFVAAVTRFHRAISIGVAIVAANASAATHVIFTNTVGTTNLEILQCYLWCRHHTQTQKVPC